MRYRNLRRTSSGQWVNVLFSAADDTFSVPEISHRTQISVALSLSPDDLETVEGDSDARTGTLIAMPATPALGTPQRDTFDAASDADKLSLLADRIITT